MKKAVRILVIYLASLFIISLIFSFLGYNKIKFPYQGDIMIIKPMIFVTIIGGILALKASVTNRALKIFITVYSCLWVLRFGLTYFADQIGDAHILGRLFHFDLIIRNYYATVSRLDTPMPFVIFWFINYFFSEKKNFSESTQ